jgi:hypothetical protein
MNDVTNALIQAIIKAFPAEMISAVADLPLTDGYISIGSFETVAYRLSGFGHLTGKEECTCTGEAIGIDCRSTGRQRLTMRQRAMIETLCDWRGEETEPFFNRLNG